MKQTVKRRSQALDESSANKEDESKRPMSTRKKQLRPADKFYDFEDEEIVESPKNRKKRQTRQKEEESEPEVRRTRRLRKTVVVEESSSSSASDEAFDVDTNDDTCWKCKGKNQLICCDYCYRSFHQSCANLRKFPSGQWECPQCQQATGSSCHYCKESSHYPKASASITLNNATTTCTKCNSIMHLKCVMEHLPLEAILWSPVNKKYFSTLELQQISFELLRGDDPQLKEKQQQLVLQLMNEGLTLFYSCLNCLQSFGIGQIVQHIKIGQEEQQTYYLVLLEQSSFIHCHYLTNQTLTQVNLRKLKNYKEKYEVEDDDQLSPEQDEEIIENLEIERVIGCKKVGVWKKMSWSQILQNYSHQDKIVYGAKGNLKFYVKWARLCYDECTWEDEYFLLKYLKELKQYFQIKVFEDTAGTPQYDEEKKVHFLITYTQAMATRDKRQPLWIRGGALHQFQLDGLDWLKKSWIENNNVILADEMGLGKTIQTISFLNCLLYEYNNEGPFLIVAPATTLYNWLKEFKKWADKFNVIVYTGNQESRVIIRQREFYNKRVGQTKTCKFNALITSYDTAINDQGQLKKIKWKCLVVDEAHRLKNNESKFFKVSSQFHTDHKILLTGTPLQNNILELINLIEFIAPNKAKQLKNIESLKLLLNTGQQVTVEQQMLSEDDKKRSLAELNRLLHPHILRRTKADVKLQVPEMEEIIVKLCLTDTQKFLYKNVLLKNYDNLKVLDQKSKNVGRANLLNILMSLRLVCNHPYLFLYKRKFQIEGDPSELINQSNKLKFLDRIIPRLLEMQHKMLIFSQFTMMLDLLQFYFDLKGWSCERLDGNTGIMDRQKIIDSFNREESKSQIFLLSTRAGGLGINLTSADTIIFTDSDFNPYRDLQAISRAHRMGQVNRVKVYRLVSKHTAEERIIEIATKKLLLEEIIINPINKFTKDDFTQIFKNSTWELFNKNLEEKDQEFTEEQLNVLLQRNVPSEGTEQLSIVKNDLNDYYLSGFKFTSCNFEKANQSEEDESQKQGKIEKYWETLLDGEARLMVEKEYNELGKGKRVKKQHIPNYQEDAMCKQFYYFKDQNPSEYSPSHNNGMSESDNENQGENAGEQLIRFKKGDKVLSERMQRAIEKDQHIIKFFQTSVLETAELKSLNGLSEEDLKDTIVHGFSLFHRIDFIDHLIKFGIEYENIDNMMQQQNVHLMKSLQQQKPETFGSDIRPHFDDFKRYLKEFYSILMDFENFMDKDNIAFVGLDPQLLFTRICGLTCLKRKINICNKRPDKFVIKHDNYQRVKCQKNENTVIHHPTQWTNYDDYLLCKGIVDFGYGEWSKIVNDSSLWLTEEDKCPQWQKLFKKFNDEVTDDANANEYLCSIIESKAQNLLNMIVESEEII